MDFWSLVITCSVAVSAVVLIVGPLLEMRGVMLFVDETRGPVVRGRVGMGLMAVSVVLFVGGLILRTRFSSAVVTPFVIGGYVLWFVGGIVAVVRNETLKAMVSQSKK